MNERPAPHRLDQSATQRKLRVTMLGIRGFPDIQGGAEKHAEKLCRALADLGCQVEAIVRSSYYEAKEKPRTWGDVKIAQVWSPRTVGVEPFVHTFLGVVRAAFTRPDVLHIHAIGPALFTPLARALGLRVVVTHHVRNYENEKWGPLGRWLLRRGEWAGMAFAHGRIAVATGLANEMSERYGVPVSAIPNGIDRPAPVRSTDMLQAFGLQPNQYAVTVARIDAQKRQLDLIAAYARLKRPPWKLALVGGADYSGPYARAVADAARQTPGVVMLGHQSGQALAALYSHAGAFVLPSSHEGQPIAVLEAASFGLNAILSDIPAHREIDLPRARYFAVGDITALAEHLQAAFATPGAEKLDEVERARILARHDWQTIARRTIAVYRDALSGANSGTSS